MVMQGLGCLAVGLGYHECGDLVAGRFQQDRGLLVGAVVKYLRQVAERRLGTNKRSFWCMAMVSHIHWPSRTNG